MLLWLRTKNGNENLGFFLEKRGEKNLTDTLGMGVYDGHFPVLPVESMHFCPGPSFLVRTFDLKAQDHSSNVNLKASDFTPKSRSNIHQDLKKALFPLLK